MKSVFKLLIILALGTCVLSSPSRVSAQLFMMKNGLEGKTAPDFKLLSTSGKEMTLNEAKNGKGTILFFWATWCPHCREQLSQLTVLAPEFEKKGIKVLLVDVGEGAGQVQAHLEKNKVPFFTFLDQESKVSDTYEIVGVPTFFLINKDGIVKTVVHSLPEDYEEILK